MISGGTRESATRLVRVRGRSARLEGTQRTAYASGQALYALHTAGKMPTSDAVYQKGVQYLLRSQNPDGSWHVKTRSIRVQPYFESGFPHVALFKVPSAAVYDIDAHLIDVEVMQASSPSELFRILNCALRNWREEGTVGGAAASR
jgi:hypothetical protein